MLELVPGGGVSVTIRGRVLCLLAPQDLVEQFLLLRAPRRGHACSAGTRSARLVKYSRRFERMPE